MDDLNLFDPQFTHAEVCHVTGLADETLQQWGKRGILNLRFVGPGAASFEAPGKGHRRLYSASDVMQIAALAQLSRLGLSPSRLVGTVAEVVRASMGTKVQQDRGVWGEVRPELRDLHRYVMVFHARDRLEWSVTSSRDFHPDVADSVMVVIDAFDLADKVMEALRMTLVTRGG